MESIVKIKFEQIQDMNSHIEIVSKYIYLTITAF